MPAAISLNENIYHRNIFMRRLFVVWLLLLGSAWAVADETINVMFYNVENLFDTVDDPEKEDEEYLPSSARRWTQNRFQEKISNICRVLAACCRAL